MKTITSKETCISCGLCKEVCPIQIIDLASDGKPQLNKERAETCLDCGHCVAICPSNALTHSELASEKALVMPEDTTQIEAVIKNRRSIRRFTSEKISDDCLNKIFDIVAFAPTGGNAQPVNWTIIRDNSTIEQLVKGVIDWMKEEIEKNSDISQLLPMAYFVNEYENGHNRITFDGPCVVISHAEKSNGHAHVDCTIALSYLEITSNFSNLGSLWAGALDFALKSSPNLRTLIGIPDHQINHGCMVLGNSALRYPQVPERKAKSIHWI